MCLLWHSKTLRTYDTSNTCLGRFKTKNVPDLFTSTEKRIIVDQALKLVFKKRFRGRCSYSYSYSFLGTFFYQITLDHRIGRRKLAMSFYCGTYSVILQSSSLPWAPNSLVRLRKRHFSCWNKSCPLKATLS
jgi:hypothetical protein